MKKSILLIVLLQFLILSCNKKKTDICDSEICLQYQNVWEDIFKSKNNLSDKFFKEHITVVKTSVDKWNDGESFRISYYISIDWAKISCNDQFIIKKSPTAPPYPSLNLPVDTYLTKEQIQLVTEKLALSSYITRAHQYEKLKYKSKRKAIKAIKEKIPYDNPKIDKLYYKTDKMFFTSNGNPFLKGGGIINQRDNKCYSCEIDLITGEVTYQENACRVE